MARKKRELPPEELGQEAPKKENRGGARKNAGRKPGQLNKKSLLNIERTKQEGLLPHEWLVKIMSGDPIKQRVYTGTYESGPRKGKPIYVEIDYYPSFDERVEAAKAAAPYLAPRLQAMAVGGKSGDTESLSALLKDLAENLPV